MARSLLVLLLLVPASGASVSLSDCFGLHVAGTASLRDLDTEFPPGKKYGRRYFEESLVGQLKTYLGPMSKDRKRPEAVLVPGRGTEALAEFLEFIKSGESPDGIQAGEATAIVFSYATTQTFVIDRIDRKPGGIEVLWHFQQPLDQEFLPAVALIPVEIAVGDFRIDVKEGPAIGIDGRPRDGFETPSKAVSGSAKFSVEPR